MARAHSDKLRKALLTAHRKSEGTLAEIAARIGVSRGWAWKVSAAYAKTQSTRRIPQRRRTTEASSKVVRARVKKIMRRSPYTTLRGLESELRESGYAVGKTSLWHLLRSLGLQLKRRRSPKEI